MNLERVRAVADAVMYEGYLLYPYRPSSGKNRMRWQFGVLGPPGAAAAGVGEEPGMAVQCLLRVCGPHPELLIRLRFLQLQHRQPYDRNGVPVEELEAAVRWTSWDEAVEREVTLSIPLGDLERPLTSPVEVPGGEDIERVVAEDGTEVGCIVRSRSPLSAELSAGLTQIDGLSRLEVGVRNTSAGNWEGFSREHPAASSPESPAAQESDPARLSLLGAHLLLQAHDAAFVSLLDPPPDAAAAAAVCRQCRCWPVLAGDPGEHNLVLGSPIILYDYPQVAPESATALYDATEIDEILTLRVMTMTEEEKSEARAADPRAREIIDRCDAMTSEELQRLHGTLRQGVGGGRGASHAASAYQPASQASSIEPRSARTPPARPATALRSIGSLPATSVDAPWWDPDADAAVDPAQDSVQVGGRPVRRGSRVLVRPKRQADAQDMFFEDQTARVTAVVRDVDGGVHLALVLEDDPAADLHEWYGRYLYFSAEEVEPLEDAEAAVEVGRRKEEEP